MNVEDAAQIFLIIAAVMSLIIFFAMMKLFTISKTLLTILTKVERLLVVADRWEEKANSVKSGE